MWAGKTVSVVLPTYHEKKSIRQAILEIQATGYVDEIVVVNNNAAEGTDAEVAKTMARLVHEPRQGYGFSCRRGLREAKGDLIILSEPDGSFVGRDIVKLLTYSDDFDVVLGSRTNSELIWTGANMGWFMKWGNWAVAKLMELLFNTVALTDVGCTMRLIHRPALEMIFEQLRVGGSHFSPEMMLQVINHGFSIIEIPVNYRQRVGQSSVTGNRWRAFTLGLEMIWFILTFRLAAWLRPQPRHTPAVYLAHGIRRRGYGTKRRVA